MVARPFFDVARLSTIDIIGQKSVESVAIFDQDRIEQIKIVDQGFSQCVAIRQQRGVDDGAEVSSKADAGKSM